MMWNCLRPISYPDKRLWCENGIVDTNLTRQVDPHKPEGPGISKLSSDSHAQPYSQAEPDSRAQPCSRAQPDFRVQPESRAQPYSWAQPEANYIYPLYQLLLLSGMLGLCLVHFSSYFCIVCWGFVQCVANRE